MTLHPVRTAGRLVRGRTALPAVGLAAVLAAAACTAQTSSPAAPTTGAPAPAGPANLQAAFESVVRQVLPSVVQITTGSGLGSGVVYDGKGDIVTNAHVVGSDQTFQVTLASGGSALSARLIAAYPPDDLAVIRLVDPPPSLHPAGFADSTKLAVGQIVMAVGNPLGLSGSVTEGIVSQTGRTVSEPQSPGSPGATIADAIQTSAAINPGNSGGALVDLDGHVVGIPTLAATDPQLGGTAPGIGFAIPSNTATSIAKQIVDTGGVSSSGRAALSISARTVVDASGQPAGVGVVQVTSGGAADKAGIRAGDVITAINDTPTPTSADLQAALAQLKPGDTAKVTLMRADGGKATAQAKLDQLR